MTLQVYEYAGFKYGIKTNSAGVATDATPLPGQHSAAGKAKHIMAAVDCFNSDNAPPDRFGVNPRGEKPIVPKGPRKGSRRKLV